MIRNQLDLEALGRAAERVLERRSQKRNEVLDFHLKPNYNFLLKKIKKYNYLDDMMIFNNIRNVEGISHEDYILTVLNIFDRFNDEITFDGDSSFPIQYIDYEGMRFGMIHDQGTNYFTKVLE